MNYRIRNASHNDATAISHVVITALRESNSRDYPPEIIAEIEQNFSPAAIAAWLGERRVFVAVEQDELIAVATLDGQVVRTVFVQPAKQGRGVGRSLIDTVHRAATDSGIHVLRVRSSITAERFYAGLGYQRIRDEFHASERTIVMEIALPA